MDALTRGIPAIILVAVSVWGDVRGRVTPSAYYSTSTDIVIEDNVFEGDYSGAGDLSGPKVCPGRRGGIEFPAHPTLEHSS
jgi:hypothetical protein